MVHVNGPIAVPVAVKVCEYGTVTVPLGNDVGAIARVGAGNVNVTVHVVLATKLPPHPLDVATVYPTEVVVAVTAKVSLTLSTKDAVPSPVVVALDVASVTSVAVMVEVAPFWSPTTVTLSVLVELPPPQFTVQPFVATVMVELAELLPGFGSVDEEDSPTTAVFVTWVPTDAVTVAATWSVAVEFAERSPIVQVPVEVA
jgi:hypothetical protein